MRTVTCSLFGFFSKEQPEFIPLAESAPKNKYKVGKHLSFLSPLPQDHAIHQDGYYFPLSQHWMETQSLQTVHKVSNSQGDFLGSNRTAKDRCMCISEEKKDGEKKERKKKKGRVWEDKSDVNLGRQVSKTTVKHEILPSKGP